MNMTQAEKDLLHKGKPVFVAAGATVTAESSTLGNFVSFVPHGASVTARLIAANNPVSGCVSDDGTDTGDPIELFREVFMDITEITTTTGTGTAFYAAT